MSFCRAYPKYGECHPPHPPPKFIVDILFMALARASPPGINFIWATFAHPPRPYFGRSGRANGREFVQNAIDLFSIEIIMRYSPSTLPVAACFRLLRLARRACSCPMRRQHLNLAPVSTYVIIRDSPHLQPNYNT